jgi:hypothetical protein
VGIKEMLKDKTNSELLKKIKSDTRRLAKENRLALLDSELTRVTALRTETDRTER